MVKVIAVSLFLCKDSVLTSFCILPRRSFVVKSRLWAVCMVIVVAALQVKCHTAPHIPCQALVQLVAVESLTHNPACGHQLAHYLFGLIHLPVTCLQMLERCAAAKPSLLSIYGNTFRETVFAAIRCTVGYINYSLLVFLCRRCRHRRSCGNDIDNATNGFATIQSRASTGEDLNTLYIRHIDARITVITRQPFSILQN